MVLIGGFNIDGVVLSPKPPPSPPGGEEWDGVRFDDPSGNAAELGAVNASYNKVGNINEHTPTPANPTLGYTDVNPGNDLTGVWLDTNVAPDPLNPGSEAIFLYFAFEREAESNGQIGFEFQEDSPPLIDGAPPDYSQLSLIEPANAYTQNAIDTWNPWDNRQTGDFSLVFDTQGQNLVVVLCEYDEVSGGFNSTTLDSTVSAAMFSADGLRGEGAVNLTAILDGGCFSFDNIIPYSVTGNSDRADFKDVVLADFASAISIENCGFSIDKTGDPLSKVGDTVTYTITITNDGFAGSPALMPTSIEDTLAGTLDPADFTETGGDPSTNGNGYWKRVRFGR